MTKAEAFDRLEETMEVLEKMPDDPELGVSDVIVGYNHSFIELNNNNQRYLGKLALQYHTYVEEKDAPDTFKELYQKEYAVNTGYVKVVSHTKNEEA